MIKLFCDWCGCSIGEPVSEDCDTVRIFFGLEACKISHKRGIYKDSSDNFVFMSSLICLDCEVLLAAAIEEIRKANIDDEDERPPTCDKCHAPYVWCMCEQEIKRAMADS